MGARMNPRRTRSGGRSPGKRIAAFSLLVGLLWTLQTCNLSPTLPEARLPSQIPVSTSPTPFQPLAPSPATQGDGANHLTPSTTPGSPGDPDPDAAQKPVEGTPSDGDEMPLPATHTPTASPSVQTPATVSTAITSTPTATNLPTAAPKPPSSTSTPLTLAQPTATTIPASTTPERTDNPPSPTGTESAACSVTGDASFEAALIALINQERTDRGMPSLVTESQLTAAARVHSRDMACEDFLSHTGSDGSSPGDRVTAQGYSFNALGENIYAGSGPYNSPQQTFQA